MNNTALPYVRLQWINPLWFVMPATTIVFALGWSNLGGLQAALIGVAGGLIWSIVLAGMARLVQRLDNLAGRLATGVLLAAAAFLFLQMGGGLYETMLMLRALQTMPEWITTITGGPLGDQVILFFIIFNTTMEVLLVPLAVLLNWHMPRRRAFVLAAAVLFYVIRIWTYLYFAPQYIDFGDTGFSPQLVEDLRIRISREPIRAALMITEAVLFYTAALVPATVYARNNEEGRH